MQGVRGSLPSSFCKICWDSQSSLVCLSGLRLGRVRVAGVGSERPMCDMAGRRDTPPHGSWSRFPFLLSSLRKAFLLETASGV